MRSGDRGGTTVSGTADDGDAAGIGRRLRELRRAAGLTQDELAAGRFTKQYVSQIERGATVPSEEALEWIADGSVSSPAAPHGAQRRRARACRARSRTRGAPARRAPLPRGARGVRTAAPIAPAGGAPRAAPRAARGEVWALVRLGRVTEAAEVLARGTRGDGGRAGRGRVPDGGLLLHDLRDRRRPGRVRAGARAARRLRRSRTTGCASTSTSGARAATAASATGRRPARTSSARSSSARRLGRPAAQRRGEPPGVTRRRPAGPLGARAALRRDRSRSLRAVGDTVTKARVLNNLADFNHLLGNDEVAIAQLRRGVPDLRRRSARGRGGLRPQLARRDPPRARRARRRPRSWRERALALLEGRIDHVQELGTAQLVLARAHLEQGELDQAEEPPRRGRRELRTDRVGQPSGALVDDARRARAAPRQNDAEAARLYREAATALQPHRPRTGPSARHVSSVARSSPRSGEDTRGADRRQLGEHYRLRVRTGGSPLPRKELRHGHKGTLSVSSSRSPRSRRSRASPAASSTATENSAAQRGRSGGRTATAPFWHAARRSGERQARPIRSAHLRRSALRRRCEKNGRGDGAAGGLVREPPAVVVRCVRC